MDATPLPHPAIETQQILRKQLNAARALNAEVMVEQDRLKALIADLWDFIENCTDEDPDRTGKFFALRVRVREVAWSTAKAEGAVS